MWWESAKQALQEQARAEWDRETATVIQRCIDLVERARSEWLNRIVSTEEAETMGLGSKEHLERLVRQQQIPDLRRRGSRCTHQVRLGDVLAARAPYAIGGSCGEQRNKTRRRMQSSFNKPVKEE